MEININKNFLQSKLFKKILIGLGIIVAVLTIFQAGIFVGYRKASFSYRLGDNFHNTFGIDRRGGMMGRGGFPGFPPEEFTSGYGVTGSIVKMNLPTIIVAGRDGVEKVVTTNSTTLIRRFRDDVKAGDLKVGDPVIVIGAPDNAGQIEAKLIRIMPTGMMGWSNGISTKTNQ